MEALYRRVSDRQTMGSVVHELRATLSEVEKQLDQFFRNPAERAALIPVPGQLGAMRGVLSVLGLEQAALAVMHMRDDIDALASIEIDPERAAQAGTFDRVADNLGALGFLIDMLGVQPALARTLFRFDPATGALAAVMAHGEHEGEPAAPAAAAAAADAAPAAAPAVVDESALPLPEQTAALVDAAGNADTPAAEIVRQLEHLAQQALAAEQPALARAAGSALAALRGAQDDAQRRGAREDLARTLGEFAPAAPTAAPTAPPRITPDAAPGGTGLEDDAEMREIFVEEAREVVADAAAALERLADAPDDAGDMTAVRRAFHTLKGSSRMVGLREFGAAAWACEQLYNARLAERPRADAPLRQFTAEALAYFGAWVEAIAAERDDGHRSAAVVRSAEQMRFEGTRLPIVPAEVPQSAAPERADAFEHDESPGSVAADEATGACEAIELPEVIEDVLQAVPGADEQPLLDLSLPPLELVETVETVETADFATPFEASAAPELPLPSELIDFDLLAGADSIEAQEPTPAAAEPLAVSALPLPLLEEVALPPAGDDLVRPDV
ncbi:MAG TPA: Hpt domain-containing protein, partial [Rubrivivax sp.]|nr:Hpt domain-containing protein [Rubrivivax sp.]